jgi:hypothetical protein
VVEPRYPITPTPQFAVFYRADMPGPKSQPSNALAAGAGVLRLVVPVVTILARINHAVAAARLGAIRPTAAGQEVAVLVTVVADFTVLQDPITALTRWRITRPVLAGFEALTTHADLIKSWTIGVELTSRALPKLGGQTRCAQA